jgi:hypothetical protein
MSKKLSEPLSTFSAMPGGTWTNVMKKMQRPRAIRIRSDIVLRTGSSESAGIRKRLLMDKIVSSTQGFRLDVTV